MYADRSFPSKAAFKRAIAAGQEIRLFAPGLGAPNQNGKEYVSGPNFKPHSWYAEVTVDNGIVTKVK